LRLFWRRSILGVVRMLVFHYQVSPLPQRPATLSASHAASASSMTQQSKNKARSHTTGGRSRASSLYLRVMPLACTNIPTSNREPACSRRRSGPKSAIPAPRMMAPRLEVSSAALTARDACVMVAPLALRNESGRGCCITAPCLTKGSLGFPFFGNCKTHVHDD